MLMVPEARTAILRTGVVAAVAILVTHVAAILLLLFPHGGSIPRAVGQNEAPHGNDNRS